MWQNSKIFIFFHPCVFTFHQFFCICIPIAINSSEINEVALISCPRSLEYRKAFCHVTLVDGRLDFSGKNDFMNGRCDSVELFISLTFLLYTLKRQFLVRAVIFDLLRNCVLLTVVGFRSWVLGFSLLWVHLAHAFWFLISIFAYIDLHSYLI